MESFIISSPFPLTTRPFNRFQKRGIFLNTLFLLVLLSLSYVLIRYDLDRRISALFYNTDTGWQFTNKEPWNFMHRYGHLPGIVFALASFLLYITSLFKTGLARYRRYFLVVILTAGIGGGVIVNIILKDNWGRPRPHQIREFGGPWEYKDMNTPGVTGKGRSFSCGHCTMGYIFLSTVFFYESSKRVAIAGGFAGLVFGVIMSLTRIGQGGHFASDTLWSLGIVLITANTLYNLLLFPPEQDRPVDREKWRRRERRVSLAGFGTIGATALFGLFLSPVYEEYRQSLDLPSGTEELYMKIDFKKYNLDIIRSSNSGTALYADIRARGLPSVKITHKTEQTGYGEKSSCVEYSTGADGYLAFAELNVTVSIPSAFKFHELTTRNCKQE